ncbi:hypothetical protein Ahy_B02g059669 [Arachis hypogaea]|uniref:Uncharacterized protein n=1 Tax=Arachis hypogaea TaxID=3818 RepID=A0A445AH36_ARAHY|nr:hypothetical protein Ahy_B02g059669 [Arachis hypogaea]
MAEWLKRPTHNWRIRRFNSYWMHANGTLPQISLSDFCSRMKSYWNCPGRAIRTRTVDLLEHYQSVSKKGGYPDVGLLMA